MSSLAPMARVPRQPDIVQILSVMGRTLTRAEVLETEFGQLLLAKARSEGSPVDCLCRGKEQPLPLYLRRFGGQIIVCRMPTSGLSHDPNCAFYGETEHADPERDRSAIIERQDGTLDVHLALPTTRTAQPGVAGRRSGVASTRAKARDSIGLRGLLNLLWEQAHLNRWYPAMARKRHWSKVGYFVGQAATQVYVDGVGLSERLVRLDPYAKKTANRLMTAADIVQASGQPPGNVFFVLGTTANKHAKSGPGEITLSGLAAQINLDDKLVKKEGDTFETARHAACAVRDSWLVALFAVRLMPDGALHACAAAWMPVTNTFLPFANENEAHLLGRLVEQERSIWIGLRRAEVANRIACTDTDERFTPLNIVPAGATDDTGPGAWRWLVDRGDIPPLPPKKGPRA